MYRALQMCVYKGHGLYPYFSDNCIKGTDLYNSANYMARQYATGRTRFEEYTPLYENQMEVIQLVNEITKDTKFFPKKNKWLSYTQLDYILKTSKNEQYYALPAHTNQKVLKKLLENYKSYFESIKMYKSNPDMYTGKPKLPKYKKKGTKSTIFFTNQTCKVKDNKYLRFPGTKERLNIGKCLLPYEKLLGFSNETNNDENETIDINETNDINGINETNCVNGNNENDENKKNVAKLRLKEVRVKPVFDYFVVDIVIEIPDSEENTLVLDEEYTKLVSKRFNSEENKEYIKKYKDDTTIRERALSIDIGLSNLCAIVNNFGKQPIILNGNPLKARNQWYNKELAKAKSLAKTNNDTYVTNYIASITANRNNYIKDYMHKVSRYVVKYAKENNVDIVFVGHNNYLKNESNMGRENNQAFVQIPFNMLISMLSYKLLEANIKLVLVDESYTSKSSFLDMDILPNYKKGADVKYKFSGRRVHRGLYKTKDGILINADINGAANILRKVFPKVTQWDRRIVEFSPLKLNIA